MDAKLELSELRLPRPFCSARDLTAIVSLPAVTTSNLLIPTLKVKDVLLPSSSSFLVNRGLG